MIMSTSSFRIEHSSVLSEILQSLAERRDLNEPQLRWMMTEMMAGRCGEAEASAFLLGLRHKGETASEIAWAARVLREHMVRWDPECDDVLDTCGTGGDGSGSFNISTATALVVAAQAFPLSSMAIARCRAAAAAPMSWPCSA